MDCQSYSGIRRYSNMGGGGGGGEEGGRVVIPRLSMDGQSYSGIRGYSGGGGWTPLDYPWMVILILGIR